MSTDWKKIAKRLGLKNKKDLAVIVESSEEAFLRSTSGNRTLSPERELKILEALAKEFVVEDKMLDWLDNDVSFFAPYLSRKQKRERIRAVFLLKKIFPPRYYLVRSSVEEQLINALVGISDYSRSDSVVVSGVGGIGKSSLLKAALQKAVKNHSIIKHYEQICWIDCDGKEFAQIVLHIAGEFGLPNYEVTSFLPDHIKAHLHHKAVLLVLDGLNNTAYLRDILSLVNRAKSKVIVTSRNAPDRTFLGETNLQLYKLEDGFTFLDIQTLHEKIVGTVIHETAGDPIRYLLKKTEGLPLAWTILCSMKSETKESWISIKERYSIHVLQRGVENTKDNSVNTSLMLSYASLAEKHTSAALLCSLMGVFQHTTIFVDRLKYLYSRSLFDTFEQDLAILVRFGLVTVQDIAGTRVLSVHSLLHEAVQLLARDTLSDYHQYELLLIEKIASTPFDALARLNRENHEFSHVLAAYHEILIALELAGPFQKLEIIESLESARILGAINIVFDIIRISGLPESGYSAEAYVEDVLSLFKSVAEGKASLEKYILAPKKDFFELDTVSEDLLPERLILESPHAIDKVFSDLSLSETVGPFLTGLDFIPNKRIKADALTALDDAVFVISFFLAKRDYQRALEICEEISLLDDAKEFEVKCKLLQARIFERAGEPEKALALLQEMQFSTKEGFLKVVVAFYVFILRRANGNTHAVKFFQQEWSAIWETFSFSE